MTPPVNRSAISPVTGQIHLLSGNEVAITISPDEPVFAGHYPGFPIFPGMCVVEVVHRGALLTAPAEAGETVIFEGECVVRGELVFTVSKMVVAYRPAEQLRAATGGHDH
ncbi:hypothetical protein OIE13_09870 [Streptosporangium sp. NBC_01810]|uniref:hypothetical protein n=1 Tax=Streptosporangium sp. NBC_01810 TaxID=2975951 RepID=UPI002DD7E094|nr:hypothetical protein [Streptosporangium sp. NBC_01810]WSA28141.1 hypothetical protein OIE13_09870 [Streptosporangium sp. NBC_01810]